MDLQEELLNNIMIAMSAHLAPAALSILKEILIKQLSHYSLSITETLPATADDSNEYIIVIKKKEAAFATSFK